MFSEISLSLKQEAPCFNAGVIRVDQFNEYWKDHIEQKLIEPLGESFKADRFKSMTGLDWQGSYSGYKRSRTGNKQSLEQWLKERGN